MTTTQASTPTLRQRKLGLLFEVFDSDDDGYLDQRDLEHVGQRAAEILISAQDPAGRQELRDGVQAFTRQLMTAAGIGPDGRLSKSGLYTAVNRGLLDTDEHFDAGIGRISRAMFQGLDRDGDQALSLEEFTRFWLAVGSLSSSTEATTRRGAPGSRGCSAHRDRQRAESTAPHPPRVRGRPHGHGCLLSGVAATVRHAMPPAVNLGPSGGAA